MTKGKIVHGDDLLYRFFQTLLTSEDEAYAAVPQLLLESMAVWLPLDVYASWPILLPWVVRDPSCRGSKRAATPDQWGSPDAAGHLRDDNSLIKGLPRSLSIRGPKGSGLSGARMGTEFVAAHIWRTVNSSTVLASRWPELNSFVPNLVWLPGQIAKLTDREGSVVQETLQAMSWRLYRDAPVDPHLQSVVDTSWSMLPPPSRTIAGFEPAALNWFEPTEAFFRTRRQRLTSVIAGLRDVDAGRPLQSKIISSRYTEGLPLVDRTAVRALLARLEGHESADVPR